MRDGGSRDVCAKILGFSLLLFPSPKFLGAMLRWKLRPSAAAATKLKSYGAMRCGHNLLLGFTGRRH
jgi:hypothetical protein